MLNEVKYKIQLNYTALIPILPIKSISDKLSSLKTIKKS